MIVFTLSKMQMEVPFIEIIYGVNRTNIQNIGNAYDFLSLIYKMPFSFVFFLFSLQVKIQSQTNHIYIQKHMQQQPTSNPQHAQKQQAPPNQEHKNKIQLEVLGEQPFIINEEDEEADFISCRIGEVKEGALMSERLKTLQLRNNLISEIRGLDKMPNLIELQLYDNRILEIKGLDNLPQLQILDLSYNNIKKIENLNNLPNLRKLFLLSNKIKKIENLQFPKLQMLELGSNKIKIIENLDKLPMLTALYLGKNRISTIQNLHHFKRLQQIALGPNRLTKIQNIECLKDTLRELYLQQNKIAHIQNVNCLHKLEILDISYNQVQKLQGINQLSELDALYLTTNKIDNVGDLKILVHNQKLTTISLFGNDVCKSPDYRMKLVEILPLIDDIDGTPMKTTYKIVFDSDKKIEMK